MSPEALAAFERLLFWYEADRRKADPEYSDDVMEKARAVIQEAMEAL